MQEKREKIVIIAGPTAVGKTKFAIDLAKQFGGEIVSADSMQIYRWMDIGSAKPTAEEQAQVRHHLIDQIDPREPFSVAEYQSLAKACIADILQREKLPLISGGTGLYLNALMYEMNFSVMPKQSAFREKLEQEAQAQGNEAVYAKLQAADPQAAARIHPNNLKKVIRALEVYETSGEGIRDFEDAFVKTKDYDWILLGLQRDREELYQRIDRRVDMLLDLGLEQEIQDLLAKGLAEAHISMKGIGYKEIIDYFHGKYDRAEAIRLIKRNTRHYAKRQMTWLRRYEEIKWFDLSSFSDDDAALHSMAEYCTLKLKEH